jgi:asparagine synthase (glutamine-hydrolysing)
MSGIGGLFNLDGAPALREDLAPMLDRISHRGPDRSGEWVSGAVALGHRMLCTTPESLDETLPLVRCAAITSDARLDNRAELTRALGTCGPDSSLILEAYERWGEDCVPRLLGDFAFAIWDPKRNALFCARDPLGVRPFVYRHDPGRRFAFASEARALHAPRRINETFLAECLAWMSEDPAATAYEGILRLPAAHTLTVNSRGAVLRRYWSLDPGRELRLGSDGDYAEAFREIFTSAVTCRLRSAGGIGSELSGGLDSASVVCFARGLARLHTFSAVFPDSAECDERPYLDAVESGGSIVPHRIQDFEIGRAGDLEAIVGAVDHPLCPPGLFIHMADYREARRSGLRVLLDGFDGDSVVSHGMSRLVELLLRGRWRRLAAEIASFSRLFHRSPWQVLRGDVIRPLCPDPLVEIWRSLRGKPRLEWREYAVVGADLARRTRLFQRLARTPSRFFEAIRNPRTLHWRHLISGDVADVLEMRDKLAASFSIELRHPFFDRRLVEFCLALPADQKIEGGWNRIVLRRAMEGILPEAVRWRGDKARLSVPFLCRLPELGRRYLDEPPESASEYLDMTRIRALRDRCRLRPSPNESFVLLQAASVLAWAAGLPSRLRTR